MGQCLVNRVLMSNSVISRREWQTQSIRIITYKHKDLCWEEDANVCFKMHLEELPCSINSNTQADSGDMINDYLS